MAATKTSAIPKMTIDPETIDGVKRWVSDADLAVIIEQAGIFFPGAKALHLYSYMSPESDDPSDENVVLEIDSDLPRVEFNTARRNLHSAFDERGLPAYNRLAITRKYTGK